MKRLIRAAKKSGLPESNAPVGFNFILSSPRSGSTWLKKMLNGLPRAYCTENRFFGEHADLIHDVGVNESRLRVTLDRYVSSLLLHTDYETLGLDYAQAHADMLSRMLQAVVGFTSAHKPNATLFDKITPYVGSSELVVHRAKNAFPNGQWIQLVRDGRDVMTSGIFHWFNKQSVDGSSSAFLLQRKQWVEQGGQLDRFFTDDEIAEWTATWQDPYLALDQISDAVSITTVSYEELKANPAGCLVRILAATESPATDAEMAAAIEGASFKAMSGGRESGQEVPDAHVRKGIVGDWQHYFTRRDGACFHELAGPMMQQLGYEPDASWLETLPPKLPLRTVGKAEG